METRSIKMTVKEMSERMINNLLVQANFNRPYNGKRMRGYPESRILAGEEPTHITVNDVEGVWTIIDGQHRTTALYNAFMRGDLVGIGDVVMNLTIHTGLNFGQEYAEFVRINELQKKLKGTEIDKGLVITFTPNTLMQELLSNSELTNEARVEVGRRLQSDEDSPLKGLMASGRGGVVPIAVVLDSFVRGKTLGAFEVGQLNENMTFENQLNDVKHYITAFLQVFNLPTDKKESRDYITFKAIGFPPIMKLYADIRKDQLDVEKSVAYYLTQLGIVADVSDVSKCTFNCGQWKGLAGMTGSTEVYLKLRTAAKVILSRN